VEVKADVDRLSLTGLITGAALAVVDWRVPPPPRPQE